MVRPHTPKTPLVLLALLLIAPACASAPAAPGGAVAGDLDGVSGRVSAAEAVDAHVRRYFAHWEGVPHLDYAAAADAYRAEAAAVGDRLAFAFATMRFLALLENGHTDAGDARVWGEMGAPLPFTLRHLEGEWVVAASRDERMAAGSVIRAIDGRPFEAFFREVRPYLSASDERWARRILGSRPFLFPERFVLSLADGRSLEVERRALVSAVTPASQQVAQESVPHRWLAAESVALLRLSTFGSQEVEERALDLLRGEMGGASALVLDLRGNGGGNTPWKLRKALLRGRGGHDWRWRTVEDHTTSSLLMRVAAPLAVRLYRPPPWEGPLVLLVDGGCFSACEDLVGSLRGAPGVRLVGETTGGSTGQPIFLSLAEGFSVRVSARRQALPDGTPFEGRGIAPDVVVGRSIEDLRAGSDPALAAALAEARRMLP